MQKIFFSFILTLTIFASSAQHIGSSFEDAEKKGITIPYLDNIYKSAIHVDSTKAVFKSEEEQLKLVDAYQKLLRDLGQFLSDNHFIWDKPTKSTNRIYFNNDGNIDYFLYHFSTRNIKPEDQLPVEKQKEFNRLLNVFITDYKFPLKAKTKFSQCSPVTYMPKREVNNQNK